MAEFKALNLSEYLRVLLVFRILICRHYSFMHATFAHTEDVDAIPPDGKVIIQVVAPQVDKKRGGGIGLDA